MSLIDRIKKARAKAEKLSEKSKKAKAKGKDKRSANLEKRSKKKSEKATKLGRKPKQIAKQVTSFMAGTAFGVSKPALMKSGLKGTGETMQHAGGEKMHTLSPHYNKPKFPTPAPYHGNTKDTGGKPPKSLKKKNKK